MGITDWLRKKAELDQIHLDKLSKYERLHQGNLVKLHSDEWVCKKLVLGPPVESIIAEMKQIGNWKLTREARVRFDHIDITLTHTGNDLSILFKEEYNSGSYPDYKITTTLTCKLTWTTPDENKALVAAYSAFLQLVAEDKERERIRLADIERSKFMVFIPKDE